MDFKYGATAEPSEIHPPDRSKNKKGMPNKAYLIYYEQRISIRYRLNKVPSSKENTVFYLNLSSERTKASSFLMPCMASALSIRHKRGYTAAANKWNLTLAASSATLPSFS